MNNTRDINLEEIFNNTKKLRKIKNLEIALRGGEYHFIEFKDNVIKNSLTKENYYLSVRGIYKKNYFSFNSKFKDNLFNMIKVNQKIKSNVIKYPFLKATNYRDNNISDINFETFNNLLLLELISKPIFKLLKEKFIINGFIYLKKDRVSPFTDKAPVISLINNNGLVANHRQNKIILNLELTAPQPPKGGVSFSKNLPFRGLEGLEYSINKIFNNTKDVEEYLTKKIEKIEKNLKLPIIKNYKIKNEKIIFSSKAIAKILHKIKEHFSISNYNENKNNIFREKKDKKIFSHKINIQDTAYHPILPIIPFDEIGEERSIVNLIRNGYLREFTSSYYESIKYNTPLTGHSLLNTKKSMPFSLYLKGGDIKTTSIIASEKQIVYIEDLEIKNTPKDLKEILEISSKYHSIIYKNGIATKIIKNLDISVSLEDIFMRVVEVTSEKEELGMITPDIFVSL